MSYTVSMIQYALIEQSEYTEILKSSSKQQILVFTYYIAQYIASPFTYHHKPSKINSLQALEMSQFNN